jgi:NADH dehydrogenase
MSQQPAALDLVTGAFSYSGAHIARRLLDSGRQVRTLTFHPDRDHPLRGQVQAFRFDFDDPVALARTLEGVDTVYNTYWVRFDHGNASFNGAVANSRTLFHAARRAGVRRIVHLSIANPSVDSPLAYYRGKAPSSVPWRRSACRSRSSGRPGSSAVNRRSWPTTSHGS